MHRFLSGLTMSILAIMSATGAAGDYDPLKTPASQPVQSRELTILDEERSREIPVRVMLPKSDQPSPVILFSHGLGGSRNGCSYLGEHWAARGYVVVYIQHPGSDESVWRDIAPRRRMQAMRNAASARNFLLRVQDVAAVLNELEGWQDSTDHELAGRFDLTRIGMSGHSFGAVTTQAVSGQSFGRAGQQWTDPRIDAAICFSPSSPRRGDSETAFADVRVPWMLMTGTEDDAPIGDQSPQSRREVYPALPDSAPKFELVLHEAEHSAFADQQLPGERLRRNPNHHRAILALSTAFWDSFLRDDEDANAWLKSDAVRDVLEPADEWQLNVPSTSSVE